MVRGPLSPTLVLVMSLVGCLDFEDPDAFPCQTDEQCEGGWYCREAVCVKGEANRMHLDFTVPSTYAHEKLSFERASQATYFGEQSELVTAGEDEPRLEYAAPTGVVRGMLVEEARTNRIADSSGAGVGDDALPNGWESRASTGLSVTLQETPCTFLAGYQGAEVTLSAPHDAPGQHRLVFQPDPSTGADAITWTASIWYERPRPLAAVAAELELLDRNATELASTALPEIPGRRQVSTTLEQPSNGVQMSIQHDVRPGETLVFRVCAPQLEDGLVATSLIPTPASAATREADSAIVDIFPPTPELRPVSIKVEILALPEPRDGRPIFSLASPEASSADGVLVSLEHDGRLSIVMAGGGTTQIATSQRVVAIPGASLEVELHFAPNRLRISSGGVEQAALSNIQVPRGLAMLWLGAAPASPARLNGHVRSVEVTWAGL